MRRIFALLPIVLTFIIVISAVPVSALRINSHDAEIGDTISYDVHAIACPTKVQAVDISVYYDSSVLELVDGSLNAEALPGAVTNTKLDGEIRINAITLSGFEFSEDGILASMQFTVIDDTGGDAVLYYEVKNFLDENKTELKDTYTYDVTRVNSTGDNIVDGSSASETITVSSANSYQASSSAQNDNASDIIFDITSYDDTVSEEQNQNTSSLETEIDIPSELAIRKDTLDTPSSDKREEKKRYLMILLMGIGIVILIAVMFRILLKDSGSQGSHFSK